MVLYIRDTISKFLLLVRKVVILFIISWGLGIAIKTLLRMHFARYSNGLGFIVLCLTGGIRIILEISYCVGLDIIIDILKIYIEIKNGRYKRQKSMLRLLGMQECLSCTMYHDERG